MNDSILSSSDTTTDSILEPYLKTQEKNNTEKDDEQRQTKRKCNDANMEANNTSNTLNNERPNKRMCNTESIVVGIKRLLDDLEVTAAKKEIDQDSAHMVAASKVHMLKPGEYELWWMRMEQYIKMIDYSLWEVIENGNAPPITKVVEGVETTIAPTTAEKKHKGDAKSLLQAVKKRFRGIAASKKTQRNLLNISQEDVNKKFLRCLSPEWNTHTIVWRNKPEIDTLSLDDLYNNMKIYKPEVKGTSSSSTNTQNVAFVSSNSTSSTNGVVNTVHGATTASTLATAVNSTIIDNLSDAVICAFFAS
ncbi:hypothetical protein Tco_0520657 [Tanacetum coccineum]